MRHRWAWRVEWLAAIVLASAAGCAHAPLVQTRDLAWQMPPAVATGTLALWRFDETSGLLFADASSGHANGVFGIDTRTAYGRFLGARKFIPSINSFAIVYADRAPVLPDTWTIEAWIRPEQYGPVECSIIASRWTNQPNEQGWVLGLTGFNRSLLQGAPVPPQLFTSLFIRHDVGLLVFAFQPAAAGTPRAYVSTLPIDLNRWTHVAVTQDGHEMRLYIDGRLDSQYAEANGVRDVPAPLVIGNQIDARWLTESQGALRVPIDSGIYPFYAFEGAIDEVRISDAPLVPGPPHK